MYYVTLIVGIVALSIIFGVYQQRSPMLDREIKGAITISSDWIEITPDKPLKPTRDVQMITIALEPPFQGEFEAKAIRTPDGSLVQPQVQLVDQNGNTFELNYGGFRGRMAMDFSNFDKLPKDREYKTVRIRSDKPINCKKILWSCYNWKDLK